jgi:hypothetical protein
MLSSLSDGTRDLPRIKPLTDAAKKLAARFRR